MRLVDIRFNEVFSDSKRRCKPPKVDMVLNRTYRWVWFKLDSNGYSQILFVGKRERDVAQSIACPPLKRSVVGSILLSGPSCSLGYFPFQPVVHNWFIKGRGMYCSVYGKAHIKDPLLLIEKSSLCGGSGFPSKKCVNVTI